MRSRIDRALLIFLFGGSAAVASGCFPPDEGRSPPLDRIYFPVGLAINEQATRLYVANSDFDLQYNAGTLQAYDLAKLTRAVRTYCETDAACGKDPEKPELSKCDTEPSDANGGIPSQVCVDPRNPKPCGALAEQTAGERLVAPGRCSFVSPKDFQLESVRIGAFVTDVVYRARPAAKGADGGAGVADGTGRLFLPVRGDATLHWVDVPKAAPGDGPARELECGQGSGDTCDADHRRGDEPAEENTRGVRLPPEPFGVAVDAAGEAILTTHQSNGAVALFVNQWSEGGIDGPRLEFVYSGLPVGAMGVAALPVPGVVVDSRLHPDFYDFRKAIPYEESFLVTFRNAAEVRLVRYFSDVEATTGRPFLLEASRSAAITTNSLGWDSRGVAVDDSERTGCEASCPPPGEARAACLRDCAARNGLRSYIANRTPSSMVLGKTASLNPAGASDADLASNDLPRFYDSVPLSLGVSRIVVGDVLGRDGKPLRRIFAVCFDSKKIFVYDPVASRVETVIETGNGPHALAIDSKNGLGYIGHFSESYLGVVDLDQRHTRRYGQMVLTVGEPTPPRASK